MLSDKKLPAVSMMETLIIERREAIRSAIKHIHTPNNRKVDIFPLNEAIMLLLGGPTVCLILL